MSKTWNTLPNLPEPPKQKTAYFADLSGGLNLWQLDYRMAADQSPEMKNLWWRDGLLACRDGQEYVSEEKPGIGFSCFERPFWGYMVCHIGDGLYAAKPGSQMHLQKLCGGIEPIRGTFVRYRDALIYKTKGTYKKITWTGEALQAEDVQPYVPVTVINCTPEGSGDLYQPENRLSPQKTVWYTTNVRTCGAVFSADGYADDFLLQIQDGEPIHAIEQVYVGTSLQETSAYTVEEKENGAMLISFAQAPSDDKDVTVVYTVAVREYHLPVQEVASVDKVVVDDAELAAEDYTCDLEKGIITFQKAPQVSDPPVNNTVKITYTKENEEAKKAIMDCTYACAYGGTGGAVLIMAGSEAQKNAYFWNGSHTAMDMGYFPVEYYNLAGDDLEAVTGFGEQAGSLLIFKEHAVGKAKLSSSEIDGRAYLTVDYTPVNTSIGCDLPWTIRLVKNNLVWCSTYLGVCRLDDTTPALENKVRCISRNIQGGTERPGLLQAVQRAKTVCALEDGDRYWVAADGEAYVWDHAISGSTKPSWFYFTGIAAVSFFRADTLAQQTEDAFAYTGAQPVYHLDKEGRITRFVRTYRDYGGGIEKVYTFATQDFGDLAQCKHIRKVVLNTRSDTDTVINLQYSTDEATRCDLTPVRSYSYRLLPRNLSFRFLGVRRFAHTAVRVPGCRYVRCFSLRLHNEEPGCDMSVVSAQITAEFVIKER